MKEQKAKLGNKIKGFFTMSIIFMLGMVQSVYATGGNTGGGAGGVTDIFGTVERTARNITSSLIGIANVIGVLVFVISMFLYFTSKKWANKFVMMLE